MVFKDLWPALLLLPFGCSEYDIHGEQPEIDPVGPEILVTPLQIGFGQLPEGDSSSGFFLIENVGGSELTLGDLTLVGSGAFELTTSASGVVLQPGETSDGMVTYTAGTAVATGEVRIPSDDAETPEVRVELMGGVDVPVEPGAPVAMCEVSPPVTDAVIGIADLIGDQSVDPSGQALEYTWQGVLRPAGSTAAIPGPATSADPNRLGFIPDEVGTYGFQLTVTNEDGVASAPCYTELEAVAPVVDPPIAVCSVTPPITEAVLGSADLIGDLSTDPGGLPLTYSWTGIGRPAGSMATVPGPGVSASPNRLNFVPDLVGMYDFQLVVTNSLGVSSPPCVTQLEAIPAEDLWVEMFWTHSGDDMDLHLTRAGGAFQSNQDCYYGNCVWGGLDWGPGGASGNPALDLDDISGTGPENINVTTPENVVYNVYVHDYPGSVYAGANPVTVNIYLSGVLAWTDTKDVTTEDSYVWFADVDWSTQTVTP